MKGHPYNNLESEPLWQVVNKALSELSDNKDIQITTRREYVVGFLVKACLEHSRSENGEAEHQSLIE